MKASKNYDERQLYYRYKGFTLGFIVLCSLLFVHIIFPEIGNMIFANEQASGITMLFLAIIVAVNYQAMKDAYISRKSSYRSSAIFSLLLTAITGFNFISSVNGDDSNFLNQKGQIEHPINFLTFILWLSIAVIVVFKYFKNNQS